jgi:TonB family protein
MSPKFLFYEMNRFEPRRILEKSRKPIFIYLAIGLILLGQRAYGIPQAQQVEVKSLKPIKKVIPLYPENLKEEGIAGEVAVVVTVDEKGDVKTAFVFRSLHPELDNLALEAVRQWKFEPYIYGKNPIPVPSFLSVIFKPGDSGAGIGENEKVPGEAEPGEPPSDELRTILDPCTEYCRKLSGAALFYICQEKIRESVKNVVEEETAFIWHVLEDNYVASAKYRYPVLRGTEKNVYVNDYQLINKDGKIEERLTLLEENGKKVNAENVPQRAKRPYSLQPIFVPVRLLSREQWPQFSYKMGEEEKVMGRKTWVIEVKRRRIRGGDINGGKIWVDKSNFRILKAEVVSALPTGSEQILEECSRYYLTPHFTATHFYEVEKNGVLFPSRSEILLEYTGLVWPKKDTKAKAEIKYENYRFFSVETEHKIIR